MEQMYKAAYGKLIICQYGAEVHYYYLDICTACI